MSSIKFYLLIDSWEDFWWFISKAHYLLPGYCKFFVTLLWLIVDGCGWNWVGWLIVDGCGVGLRGVGGRIKDTRDKIIKISQNGGGGYP